MTTSWSHFLHGQVEEAFHANAGGTLLCALSLLCAPIMLALGIRGRPTRSGWFSIAGISAFCVVMGIALIEWAIRLAS